MLLVCLSNTDKKDADASIDKTDRDGHRVITLKGQKIFDIIL